MKWANSIRPYGITFFVAQPLSFFIYFPSFAASPRQHRPKASLPAGFPLHPGLFSHRLNFYSSFSTADIQALIVDYKQFKTGFN
jgi:hypothetical protein